MIMYALLCGREAYEDRYMSPLQIAEGAAHRGLRPTCNKNWPPEVTSLLQVQCPSIVLRFMSYLALYDV